MGQELVSVGKRSGLVELERVSSKDRDSVRLNAAGWQNPLAMVLLE